MILIRRLLLVLLSGSTALAAESEKSNRKGRFLAVGDSPPYAQVVEGGIARELEPPADSVPPRQLAALNPAADAGTENSTLELRLGRITSAVKVPLGEGTIVLRGMNGNAESPAWLTMKRPPEGDFLALLWRKPGAKTWESPASLIVPDGTRGAPVGSVAITNLFPAAVGIQWGGKYQILKPGINHIEQLATGAVVPFRIEGTDQSGGRKRYFSSTISRNDNERTRVIIYRADVEAPRRPLQVLVLREVVEPETAKPQP